MAVQWEIRNFLKLADKQTSETFEIGTYLWWVCHHRANYIQSCGPGRLTRLTLHEQEAAMLSEAEYVALAARVAVPGVPGGTLHACKPKPQSRI